MYPKGLRSNHARLSISQKRREAIRPGSFCLEITSSPALDLKEKVRSLPRTVLLPDVEQVSSNPFAKDEVSKL